MNLSVRPLLTELDAAILDLTRERTSRFEAGAHLAWAETAALGDLARAIARSLDEWGALLADVDLERGFDADRAARLVLESVFDELLAPEPWRVLAAALAVDRACR